MRHIWLVLLVTAACSISLPAQTSTPPPPQSARQALIEMFMGKDSEDFAKHLPEDARRALIHKGETPDTSVVLRISNLGRQMVAQGQSIETFDAGPTLLLSEQKDHDKIEVVVERDSLLGEDDEIELSIHLSKDGQPESLPVVPRLIFTLQQEKEIWRLTEVTVAAHVPLTDPDYLRSLRKEQDEADESTAQSRLRIIAGAETAHAARHPDSGYTCTLSNLFPPPPEGEYGPAFADEESNGYRFTLTGCDGNPASKYRITAVPVDADAGLKTFCADESGALKSVTGGKSSTCFSRGQVVTRGEGGFYGQD
ncbi:MAG: hypothetical protein WA830_19385 [Candidatus Sulfotelmatobacter sp.]